MNNLDLGIDIGGTFTDIMLMDLEGGERLKHKVLTTPRQPDLAVVEGVRELLARTGVDPHRIRRVIHGTTLVTNAIIERRGARTALVTSAGFRDILEIAREFRYDIYDLNQELPTPLVPRYLRREVKERVAPGGRVISPLDETAVRTVARELAAEGVEATAVCLLHSFERPEHEARLRDVLEEELPGHTVALSSEVVPELGEYERMSTTVANAYVQGLVRSYLGRLAASLKEMGIPGRLFLMLSDGGICTVDTASRFPIRLIESGPAGGAMAATWIGDAAQRQDIVAFDMGGTTAKTCIVAKGTPLIAKRFEAARVYRFKRGSGLPLKIPVIDMVEIGAGGGSIARVDDMGVLRVGPQSSSSEPGPACYGRGGEDPTVTDADLLLGYLDPAYFLGGEMALDVEAARRAISEKIAKPLGLDVIHAAWGIHETVNESMASSASVHALERGESLAHYAMVAFGGAGPVHAYQVARKLKVAEIICPPAAGVLSAFGLLAAPVSFQFSRSRPVPLPGADAVEIGAIFDHMEEEGRALLAEAGVALDAVTFARTCAVRYVGQGYDVEVPVRPGKVDEETMRLLRASFEQRYLELYGRTVSEAAVLAVTWRVTASGPAPAAVQHGVVQVADTARLFAQREIYVPEEDGMRMCPVYRREDLLPGATFNGPAVVEEKESTIILSGEGRATVDGDGNVVVRLVGGGAV